MNNKALVLLSGGLDSSTLACDLASSGLDVCGLFVNYGQQMAATEKKCAKFIAAWANFRFYEVDLPLDSALTSGSLFSNEITPWENHFVSFFPQRNLLLLTIAAMYAQQADIYDIYIGIIKVNATPFPDTTEEFFLAAESLLRESYPKLNIYYPYMAYDKKAVAMKARKLHLPIDATFSCHMSKDHHCMQCPGCLDRYWAISEKT